MSLQKPVLTGNLKDYTILLYCTIALTVFLYYGSADFFKDNINANNGLFAQYYYFISSFLLLGIIPILIWRLGFGENLKSMGLLAGNLKLSVSLALAGIPVMVLLGYLSAGDPAFMQEYPLYRELLINSNAGLQYWMIYGLYYIGWESFFRGFMLFGLENKFGTINSILIQTIPSCLVHIGKPDAEIFSSIIAGVVFGYAAIKCRSIWPVFIWHWTLGVSLDIFITYA